MSLRIPLTSDQTLQVEFHEIERRLRRLEKTTGTQATSNTTVQFVGGGVTQKVDLKPITDRLDALEDAVTDLADPASVIGDFGGVGSTASRGLVPTPGVPSPPTGVAQHLVTESGSWGFPLRGLMGAVTSGSHTDIATDVIGITSSLTIAGTAYGVFSGIWVPSGYFACNQDEVDLRP